MIDIETRSRYAENQKNKLLLNAMKEAMTSATQKPDSNEEVLKLVVKREEDVKLQSIIEKIGQAIAMWYKRPLVLPKLFNVQGKIEVTKTPPVQVKNLEELGKYFDRMTKIIEALAMAIHNMPPAQVNIPKMEFPKMEPQKIDLTDLLEEFKNLKSSLGKSESSDLMPIMRKMEQNIATFVNSPRLTPQPVNNIWLNPANGFVKTTDNTVGTSVTQLPSYGQLFNRRSIMIYNNSANTIYIGGSDVTVGNGLPIPASSYGPSIDAGYDLPIYGVASQSGNDVRVIEISKDKSSNVQE